MSKKVILTFVFFALCMLIFLCSCDTGVEENSVTPASVDILKIGKADAIIINTGTKIVMIDTGEAENVEQIRSFMDEQQYSKVDVLILTHYDKDHIGGAKAIIEEYGVDTVFESNVSSNNEEFHEYHYALSQLGKSATRLKENYTFQIDDCIFNINVPKEKKYDKKNDNNTSLVVEMKCGKTKLLFCGDAQEERLAEVIEGFEGEYDFVKLPYHGNYIENYEEFFEKIKIKSCAITCSKKNPADQKTLDLLLANGVTTYETKDGTIHAKTDGQQVIIEQ